MRLEELLYSLVHRYVRYLGLSSWFVLKALALDAFGTNANSIISGPARSRFRVPPCCVARRGLQHLRLVNNSDLFSGQLSGRNISKSSLGDACCTTDVFCFWGCSPLSIRGSWCIHFLTLASTQFDLVCVSAKPMKRSVPCGSSTRGL